uniref:Uncharacterized protein n=2 Tax=Brassica oleracea TaxID=3712 RepID=A0A0D3D0P5_BRAOL|nr:unnamed protein product [Brassica oleracea]
MGRAPFLDAVTLLRNVVAQYLKDLVCLRDREARGSEKGEDAVEASRPHYFWSPLGRDFLRWRRDGVLHQQVQHRQSISLVRRWLEVKQTVSSCGKRMG